MYVYRVSRPAYAEDLSGAGARLHGGRWNQIGTAVLYASESRSLATLEALVHVPVHLTPAERKMVVLEVPREVPDREIDVDELPEDWATDSPPDSLAAIGTRWIESEDELVLRVPSAVVPGEFNVMINPACPHARNVQIASIEDFRFDGRLRPRG